MMCLNLATVCDRTDRIDEALVWYDRGADHERASGRFFAAEHRAAYLAEKGRTRESLTRFKELLGHPGLTEDDKERIRRNIDLLRKRGT